MIVLGSGNLGLVYLMDEPRRLYQEEIEERHPKLLETLRRHPHIGFLLVRSRERGPVVLGPRGARYLTDDSVEGEDPLAPFAPGAADHLRRTDGFEHVADIMVNSFYDPELEQACAFEELISFHGGLGGPQTQPFILHPVELAGAGRAGRGAAAVHDVLMGWRRMLEGAPALGPAPPPIDVGASLRSASSDVARQAQTARHGCRAGRRRDHPVPRPDSDRGPCAVAQTNSRRRPPAVAAGGRGYLGRAFLPSAEDEGLLLRELLVGEDALLVQLAELVKAARRRRS